MIPFEAKEPEKVAEPAIGEDEIYPVGTLMVFATKSTENALLPTSTDVGAIAPPEPKVEGGLDEPVM